MSVVTMPEDVGSYTKKIRDTIEDNFEALSASTAGGTLTSAHLLVGNGSNLAADVAMSGDATIDNAGVVTVASLGGLAFAGGITALDGSNPTTIDSGLSAITSVTVTLDRNSAVSSGTAFVTYHNISGGSFDVYAWVLAGSASTGTENVSWTAIGTP